MAKQNKGNTKPAPAAPAVAAPAEAPAATTTTPAPRTGGLPAGLTPPSAPPKGTHARTAKGAFVNPMPRSTVANPVAVAWQLYADLYAQHGPALTRKAATTAAMTAGVAYYTARTQYQLWQQAALASAQPPAQAAPAA